MARSPCPLMWTLFLAKTSMFDPYISLPFADRVKFSAISINSASAVGKTLDPSDGAVVCSFSEGQEFCATEVYNPIIGGSEPAAIPAGKAFHGQKAEDIPDLARLLRLGHRRADDESGSEAWGADSNLFHQGAAKESDDPDVIAATIWQNRTSFLGDPSAPTDLSASMPNCHRSGRRRKTGERLSQVGRGQGEEASLPPPRQSGRSTRPLWIMTRAEAPRARTSKGRGCQACSFPSPLLAMAKF